MKRLLYRVLTLAAVVCIRLDPVCADELDEHAADPIVMISGQFGETPTFGAGIVFGREKDQLIIVTANHVVRSGGTGATGLRVALRTAPDKVLAAKLLAHFDAALDLAVISVENLSAKGIDVCSLSLDRLAKQHAVKRGDAVYPIGNPNGVAWGMPVRSDAISDISGDSVVFQSTLIARGHSGGGLLSADGQLVAMIQADEPPYGRGVEMHKILKTLERWKYTTDLNLVLEEGDTQLGRAISENNIDEVRRLLSQACTSVNAKHKEIGSSTPLQLAARRGRLNMAKLLIEAGAEVNAGSVGNTPLGLAAESGNADLVQLLLSYGAKVNANDPCCSGPLHSAAASGAPDVVKLLLANGADPNAPGYGHQTPIFAALRAKRDAEYATEEEILGVLIQNGANVNWTDRDGDTPLLFAVEFEQPKAVKILLQNGAIVETKGRHKESAIELVAHHSNAKSREIAALLLTSSSTVVQEEGARLLGQSAREGWANVAELLIKKGVNVKERAGGAALKDAATNGRAEVVAVLLAGGANPDGVDGAQTPLQLVLNGVNKVKMEAALRLEIVQLLVSKGAKVNVDTNPHLLPYREPLFLALFELTPPDLQIAEFLTRHGAAVNARNDEGKSLLDIGRFTKNQQAINFLLKAKAR